MSKIKVKAYGLIPLTKKTYLIIQSIGAIILSLGIIISLSFNSANHSNDFINYLASQGYMNYLFWICVIVFVLEIIETYFMLKKYQQKQNSK